MIKGSTFLYDRRKQQRLPWPASSKSVLKRPNNHKRAKVGAWCLKMTTRRPIPYDWGVARARTLLLYHIDMCCRGGHNGDHPRSNGWIAGSENSFAVSKALVVGEGKSQHNTGFSSSNPSTPSRDYRRLLMACEVKLKLGPRVGKPSPMRLKEW